MPKRCLSNRILAPQASIRECMEQDREGCDALLGSHRQHLEGMRRNDKVWAAIQQLRLLRVPLDD